MICTGEWNGCKELFKARSHVHGDRYLSNSTLSQMVHRSSLTSAVSNVMPFLKEYVQCERIYMSNALVCALTLCYVVHCTFHSNRLKFAQSLLFCDPESL